MKVSLNLVKKYIDIPSNISNKQISYDLTLRTVEVEGYEDVSEKFHDIVVGKILSVNAHPDADKLRVCMVDIGEDAPKQIVCGGSNLYEGEYVVVSKPGAEVVWHGEGEPVKIKETKMRGVSSYGMICASEEVFLDGFFPADDEREIIDLKGIDCNPGDNIADVIGLNDTVLEIDNKSLTNRPDLWGHYGIARELSTIYNIPLKESIRVDIPDVPKYNVTIENEDKCYRYIGVEIDGVSSNVSSPLWMQAALVNAGMRPINAIVDITNYVMIATGQPLHAFDKTHVDGEHIIVRNAKENEELLLLNDEVFKLENEDLVICDETGPICIAGIKGGKKDSILDTTKGIVLECANFSSSTIRQTDKRMTEKTDAAMRYEKSLDTQRVDEGISLALSLIKELFPDAKILKYNDVYPVKTKNEVIDVEESFLNDRLGKVIPKEDILRILSGLGYEVLYKDSIYHVVVPTWRSTGDVSLKDDVMGDIARILSFDSFEAKPLPVNFEYANIQNKVLLERRIKEYLALRCGFNEIMTYPWIDEKYINALRIDKDTLIKLATPPAPECENLRSSLMPGMIEAISKNLRYYDNFKMFEVAQVFSNGEYHPSSNDEALPVHKKMVTGCIVGKNAKEDFYELKGVLENLSSYTHMEEISLSKGDKPEWADINAYLDIKLGEEVIGKFGLISVPVMADAKIKRNNVAIFEIEFDKLVPYSSRTNEFEHLPVLPLVEKDLSLIMDENVLWGDIYTLIKNKVREVEFIEEYRGNQIPEGKKSIVLRLKMDNQESTMTSEEINNKVDKILRILDKELNIKLREE